MARPSMLHSRRSGAASTEYILILALASLVLIAALLTYRGSTANFFIRAAARVQVLIKTAEEEAVAGEEAEQRPGSGTAPNPATGGEGKLTSAPGG